MKYCLRTVNVLILLMAFVFECPLIVDAQSFDSLRRSTGKSDVYTAVENALTGKLPASDACQRIKSGDTSAPYGGKTPIYLVLDYLATHPKQQCKVAEQLLEAFIDKQGFDVNKRYSALLPPMAYLIRSNYDFLGGRFSADYLSDEVLHRLIEAGASVNTYNSDGATLMNFAIDTDNRYLQSYFISRGIDLRHTDAKGNDAVHHTIEQGDVALLKRMVAENSVTIDINSFHNDTKQLSKNRPDMYAYLASECAAHATNYADLRLFRERFADRQQMVQQKYETLANGEIRQTVTFSDIMKVAERYPDLPHLTDPRKLSIYRQDCQRLQAIHTKALAAAKNPNYSYIPIDNYPNEFVNVYSDRYHYDPESRLPLAREVQLFYAICAGLNFSPHPYSFAHDSYAGLANSLGDMFSMLTLGIVKTGRMSEVNYPGLNEDRQLLNNALAACRSTSSLGYQDFMRRSESTILSKQRRLHEYEQQVYAEYKEYKAEQERKSAAMAQEREAKEKAKKEYNKFMEDHVNSALSEVGITYTYGEWKQSFIDQLAGVKTKSLKIEYSDGKEGLIYKHPDEDSYLPSGGIGFIFDDRYVTLSDAIAAEYFFHYGVTRTKGKK